MSSKIDEVVDDIIAKNADRADQVQVRPVAIGWFVGQVMKRLSGAADQQVVLDAVRRKLGV